MSSHNPDGYRCALLTGLIAGILIYLSANPGIAAAQDLTSETPPENPTNQRCPVLVDEPIDLDQSTTFQGKRVYLCCAMCKRKFERTPEAYIDALPQFNTPDAIQTTGGADPNQEPNQTPASRTLPEADSAHAAQDHDHTDHKNGRTKHLPAKAVAWLGKSHPASVHFPIALMSSAALAELLFAGTRRLFFSIAAQFCVWIGSVSTVVAVMLGWFFAGFNLSDSDPLLTAHRRLGTSAGFWAIMVLALSVAAARGGERWIMRYLLALFIGSGMIALDGYLDGTLIYGLDHYAW